MPSRSIPFRKSSRPGRRFTLLSLIPQTSQSCSNPASIITLDTRISSSSQNAEKNPYHPLLRTRCRLSPDPRIFPRVFTPQSVLRFRIVPATDLKILLFSYVFLSPVYCHGSCPIYYYNTGNFVLFNLSVQKDCPVTVHDRAAPLYLLLQIYIFMRFVIIFMFPGSIRLSLRCQIKVDILPGILQIFPQIIKGRQEIL